MFSFLKKLRRRSFGHYVKTGNDLLKFKVFLFAYIRSLCLAKNKEDLVAVGFNFFSITHEPINSLTFFIYFNPKTQAWELKLEETKEVLGVNQDFKPLLFIMQTLLADRLENSSYFTISLESKVKDIFLNIMYEKEVLK